MGNMVRCRHCGGTYDLGKVTIVGRYGTFFAPCCNVLVNDRPLDEKLSPDTNNKEKR
jgi:hypothetical protein